MPNLTGLEAIKEIKSLYDSVNNRLDRSNHINKLWSTERDREPIKKKRAPVFALFSIHQNKSF